jgi:hypothetical protein
MKLRVHFIVSQGLKLGASTLWVHSAAFRCIGCIQLHSACTQPHHGGVHSDHAREDSLPQSEHLLGVAPPRGLGVGEGRGRRQARQAAQEAHEHARAVALQVAFRKQRLEVRRFSLDRLVQGWVESRRFPATGQLDSACTASYRVLGSRGDVARVRGSDHHLGDVPRQGARAHGGDERTLAAEDRPPRLRLQRHERADDVAGAVRSSEPRAGQ